MELKLNSGDTITIPDGCRAVIKDKIITVEKEVQEFKDGDFVSSINDVCEFVMIYKSKKECSYANYHASIYMGQRENLVSYNDWCVCYDARIATEEEKQFLLDAIHADGKDWDAVNKRIIEYRWQPKVGEYYYTLDSSFTPYSIPFREDSLDRQLLKIGNCFKTEEEAKAKADEIIKIINK